jgi:exosortase/archaeosortase family protein
MFLLRCVIYWAVALLLVSRVPALENGGIQLTTATLVQVLRPFDRSAGVTEHSVHTSRAAIEIVPDCSPHMPFLIFAAVVLAFPASWRQRAIGLLLGALVIHGFNTVRIITLMWVLSVKPAWFEFVHVYLWQTGTILIVFVTFALWIRTLQPRVKAA